MDTRSEPKQPPNWKVGDKIGGAYTVQKLIKGAMGRYYILTSDEENKKLFVKLPSEFALSSSQMISYFTAEGRLRLEMGAHPNIVSCYFLKQIEDIPCIFLEYMDGGRLRDWIWEGRCIDYHVNLNLAIQFCHGMEFIHSKGIIHSDLKPENVLMTKEGILKINDFNTARRSPKKKLLIENPLLKKDKLIAGTPGYMSPEHFKDPPAIEERSDIFSFGLCLYEMFCGDKPYDINYVKPQEAPDPIVLSKDANFPLDLAKILIKCIQWYPEKRFSRFEDIRNELSTIYSELFNEKSPYSELDKMKTVLDHLAMLTIFENMGNDRNSVSSVVRKNTQKPGDQIKEIEIEYASKEIDDSKYSWSPKNNTLAYLTGLSIPNCELHTFLNLAPNLWKCMSCGYWASGLNAGDLANKQAIVINDYSESFKDREERRIRCVFGGITDDANIVKWSPDGQYLSIISHSGTKVFIVSIESLNPKVIEADNEIFTDIIWSPSFESLAIIGYQEKDGRSHYFAKIASKEVLDTDHITTIYYYNSEGQQDTRMTGMTGIFSGFAWSPAGNQFAVGDNYGFRTYDLDGRLVNEVIDSQTDKGTMVLEWSKEDAMFTSFYSYGLTILKTFGINTSSIKGIKRRGLRVFNVGDDIIKTMAISSHVRHAAYVGLRSKVIEEKGYSFHDLMLFNVENKCEYPIAGICIKSVHPYSYEKLKLEWSHDGTKILLSAYERLEFVVLDKNTEFPFDHLDWKSIWAINMDGSNPKPVAIGTQASWSQDGSMIAFIRELEDREKKLCVKKI
jgi:serine/threonine protein kinase